MANPQTNKWCSKLFKGALKSKVKHSKRLEVKGQGEILTSQDFDHCCRSSYRTYICDIPLHRYIEC